MKRIVISGMIGNALEWYDFALYGYLAPILSLHFFPSSDPTVSLIATYGAFAAGFAMRPLGGIVFGYIGDKFGRKTSLAAAILLMAVPTACIGLLPTYAQIGVLAPILLTSIRLLQGLSLGGEFSGAITFMVEHAPPHRRGLVGSASVFSLCLGMLIGSLTATLTQGIMEPQHFETYGWRIPFLFSVVIGVVGYYIRAYTHESPHYEEAKHHKTLSVTPVRDVFTHHIKPVLQSIGIYVTVTAPFYTLTVFLISYMSKTLSHSTHESHLINSICMFVMMLLVPYAGWLSDRIGRKKILMSAAAILLICVWPLFYWMGRPGLEPALVSQLLFTIILSFYLAPVPAILVELFPTRIRFTGMAVSYNICAALFGGTVPMICTWLVGATGIVTIPAFYLMGFCMVSLFTLYHYTDRFDQPLEK